MRIFSIDFVASVGASSEAHMARARAQNRSSWV